MKADAISPEVQTAIDSLYQGAPLGKVVARLRKINAAAALESYVSGMTARQCAEKHGLNWGYVCTIVKKHAPDRLRLSGSRGQTRRGAKTRGDMA